VEALKVHIEVGLQVLLNTCEERSCMKEIINLQNVIFVEILGGDDTAYVNELTSISTKTGTDGVAGSGTGQKSCAAGSHPAQLSLDISKKKNGINHFLTKLEKALAWFIGLL
jgi:hypothetical protein